ncbi:NODULIN HOMEOBOX [Salix purpurea]|uniref:NODULIN HOMEOBOX n=1 Tax=Salix purpurea TaxID=77065 RepID=A0A9Q0P289_SALPP|nr:NODULIN HOMEOBOX [Salix purpurea]
MSENSAIQEEKPNFKNMNQVEDAFKEDKAKSGACVSDVLREIDRDAHIVETSGSDTSSTRGKTYAGQVVNGDLLKSSEHIKRSGCQGVCGGEKVESPHFEEKQPRKRKRTIMNDYQITLMEKALLDEPEMQRNAAALQSWADKLSLHGSEVTPSQLKNWLNNRKARLARAGKDVRAPMEVDNTFPEKQLGQEQRQDTPESPGEDKITSSARGLKNTSEIGVFEDPEAGIGLADFIDIGASESVQCKPGQLVVLVDGQGEEIGKGKVYQVQGKWYGRMLEGSGMCVVDVIELKTGKWARLPYPSETTGMSFDEAEQKIGVMRVLWDSNKIYMSRPQC